MYRPLEMPNCDKGHLPLIANDPTRHWLPIRAKVIDGSWPLGREEDGLERCGFKSQRHGKCCSIESCVIVLNCKFISLIRVMSINISKHTPPHKEPGLGQNFISSKNVSYRFPLVLVALLGGSGKNANGLLNMTLITNGT